MAKQYVFFKQARTPGTPKIGRKWGPGPPRYPRTVLGNRNRGGGPVGHTGLTPGIPDVRSYMKANLKTLVSNAYPKPASSFHRSCWRCSPCARPTDLTRLQDKSTSLPTSSWLCTAAMRAIVSESRGCKYRLDTSVSARTAH